MPTLDSGQNLLWAQVKMENGENSKFLSGDLPAAATRSWNTAKSSIWIDPDEVLSNFFFEVGLVC